MLFVIAKIVQMSITWGQVNKLWYSHTMGSYAAIKKKDEEVLYVLMRRSPKQIKGREDIEQCV